MENQIDKVKETASPINLKEGFAHRIVVKHALTDAVIQDKPDPNLQEVKDHAREDIVALDPQDNLQLMLASEMASIHFLQQRIIAFANKCENSTSAIRYVSCVSKLSNVFIQQINLMQKLKGHEKKITIEHVNVHSGGQAVVGTVHTSPCKED